MGTERLQVPLVLRGGGVKGIAFASALQELEPYFEFTHYVGTSAGAVVAVLLAAGYTPSELDGILRTTDFSKFLDGNPVSAGWNLLLHGGMYRCDYLRTWLDELLAAKIDLGTIRLRDLPRHVVLFASTPGRGTVRFDSLDENRDLDVSAAVRCSMSIPILFEPQSLAGRRLYDGGLLNNFPVEYLTGAGHSDFVALYLGTGKPPRRRSPVPFEVLSIWLGRDEIALVDEHRSKVVLIDPDPVRTTDFRLSEEEKLFLVARGRAAALRFLRKRDLVNEGAVNAAETMAIEQRTKALKARTRRKWRRYVAGAVFMLLLLVGGLFFLLDRGANDDAPPQTDTTGTPSTTQTTVTKTTATDTVSTDTVTTETVSTDTVRTDPLPPVDPNHEERRIAAGNSATFFGGAMRVTLKSISLEGSSRRHVATFDVVGQGDEATTYVDHHGVPVEYSDHAYDYTITLTAATTFNATFDVRRVRRKVPPPPPPPPAKQEITAPAPLSAYTELAGIKGRELYADLVDRYPDATTAPFASGYQMTLSNGVVILIPPTGKVDTVRVAIESWSEAEAARGIDPARLWWLGRRDSEVKQHLPENCTDIGPRYECRAGGIILRLSISASNLDPRCYAVEVTWIGP